MQNINYTRLWITLLERGITKQQFREMCGISTGTMTKLNKGEPVSLTILMRACDILNCRLDELIEYLPYAENGGKKNG